MQQLDSDAFDVVVLGTGLAESIAAAALAKTGRTVLHLDPNAHYGGEQASLTLDELVQWAKDRDGSGAEAPEAGPSTYMQSQKSRYSHASTTELTSALESDKRRYALSLYPALMPARGALVHTLIASDVSKYVAFKLLDGVHIWDDGAGGGSDGKATRVPGSKEDVFKDKSVSLPDKRKLMKALMFAGGEFENDPLLKGREDEPLLAFLQSAFGLSKKLAEAITYAVAHAAPEEPALPALLRARRYLRSIGRYGPSAFLVGQYGGAGEVSQGFCRACAVFGGTYVLGPDATPSDIITTGEGVTLSIPAHPRPVSARHLLSSPDFLSPSLRLQTTRTRKVTHVIAITTTRPSVLSRPGEGEEDDDTAVVVFPPTDGRPMARVLVMGEGTGSCPRGQWVVYAWTEGGVDVLDSVLEKVAGACAFKCTYRREVDEVVEEAQAAGVESAEAQGETDMAEQEVGELAKPMEVKKPTHVLRGIVHLEPYGGQHPLTEALDHEAAQAERAYWAVVGDTEDGYFAKEVEEEAGSDED